MTRTSHRAHATPSFPVYCLGWADDETLIMGGGGGTSRSGIKNKIVSDEGLLRIVILTETRTEILQSIEGWSERQVLVRDRV